MTADEALEIVIAAGGKFPFVTCRTIYAPKGPKLYYSIGSNKEVTTCHVNDRDPHYLGSGWSWEEAFTQAGISPVSIKRSTEVEML